MKTFALVLHLMTGDTYILDYNLSANDCDLAIQRGVYSVQVSPSVTYLVTDQDLLTCEME